MSLYPDGDPTVLIF